jgi:hypothetical protein
MLYNILKSKNKLIRYAIYIKMQKINKDKNFISGEDNLQKILKIT